MESDPRSSRWRWPTGMALALGGAAWLVLAGTAPPRGWTGFGAADGPRLESLADPGGRLTPMAVRARPVTEWQPWAGGDYLRAARGEILWLRVTLTNPGREPLEGVLQDTEYYMDRVELWAAAGDGGWQRELSGESFPAAARAWWSLTPAFRVEVPAGTTREIYVRVEDYYAPFTWWRWWPRLADFQAAESRELIVKGLALGTLAALCLYNLVLWLRLRSSVMGCYVGYAVAMTVFNASENGAFALFGGGAPPAWRWPLEVAMLTFSTQCAIRFARLYLETPARLPRTDRLLRWLGRFWFAGWVGAAAMPWLWPVFVLATTFTGVAVSHALLLGVAVVSWWRGLQPAGFFMLAFGVLNVGGLPAAIGWSQNGGSHGAAIGLLLSSTLEMLLLSFAVADRFARTQRQLLAETEQRRLMKEAYADELELEVRERTRELADANADKDRMLAVIGHDLRSPLTGLMQSADRPGVDFARETARTGRALLLMIEDLVLWARLRAGTRDFAAHPAVALLQPAVALHRALAEQGGTGLTIDVPAELRIETDLVLAQTLVRNLLANALKFARSRVELRAVAVADGVRFTVHNDGPPPPADVVARLAADENEPMTATGGLGLRLCREICAALGAKLEARAPAEGGAEFGFTLPLAIAMEEVS